MQSYCSTRPKSKKTLRKSCTSSLCTRSEIFLASTLLTSKRLVNVYTGTSQNSKGYIGIFNSTELLNFPVISLQLDCSSNFSSEPNIVKLSEGHINRKISESGVYNFFIVGCEKLDLSVTVESMNPYGQLEGEYILLIPVIPK